METGTCSYLARPERTHSHPHVRPGILSGRGFSEIATHLLAGSRPEWWTGSGNPKWSYTSLDGLHPNVPISHRTATRTSKLRVWVWDSNFEKICVIVIRARSLTFTGVGVVVPKNVRKLTLEQSKQLEPRMGIRLLCYSLTYCASLFHIQTHSQRRPLSSGWKRPYFQSH